MLAVLLSYVTANNIIILSVAKQFFYGDLISPATKSFYPIVTKFGVPRQVFVKVPSIKFHGNPSSGSRANAC